MVVKLAVGGRLELTDHEANALARLLDASGTARAQALAARLDPRAARTVVALDHEEMRTLLAAFGDLRAESLPENLAALTHALADDLARVAPAAAEAYPHER
jgi:hypothetical protein